MDKENHTLTLTTKKDILGNKNCQCYIKKKRISENSKTILFKSVIQANKNMLNFSNLLRNYCEKIQYKSMFLNLFSVKTPFIIMHDLEAHLKCKKQN